MINKISHIGIAVRSIEKTAGLYQKLGLNIESTELVESQKVKVAFISIGEVRLELLEATSDDSPIAKFIEKRGEGIHHLALETGELINMLHDLDENGIRLIDKTPRDGAHNMDIAFLHPKSTQGVLLELCEKKR